MKLLPSDAKMRETDAAYTETIFWTIQSSPSSKAEPFKRSFAKVRYEGDTLQIGREVNINLKKGWTKLRFAAGDAQREFMPSFRSTL